MQIYIEIWNKRNNSGEKTCGLAPMVYCYRGGNAIMN